MGDESKDIVTRAETWARNATEKYANQLVEAETAKARASIREDLSTHNTSNDHLMDGVRQLLGQAEKQYTEGARVGTLYREEIRSTNVIGHDHKPLETPVVPKAPQTKTPTR
jgi:hypothetical protein